MIIINLWNGFIFLFYIISTFIAFILFIESNSENAGSNFGMHS